MATSKSSGRASAPQQPSASPAQADGPASTHDTASGSSASLVVRQAAVIFTEIASVAYAIDRDCYSDIDSSDSVETAYAR
jgi:hypothetical protein